MVKTRITLTLDCTRRTDISPRWTVRPHVEGMTHVQIISTGLAQHVLDAADQVKARCIELDRVVDPPRTNEEFNALVEKRLGK